MAETKREMSGEWQRDVGIVAEDVRTVAETERCQDGGRDPIV